MPSQDPLHAYLDRPTRRRLARVVHAYHEHVWAVAHRITGNAEDAADLCQDVFLRLLVKPPRAGEVRSSKGFLAWCVVGRAGKLARAAERRLARERRTLEKTSGAELPGEDIEALRSAIAGLPEDLRSPVELRYFAGMENREVAEALDLPLRTLEQRLHDARETLRKKLLPLTLSALLAGGALDAAGPGAPADLLPGLLKIAEDGSALVPASAGLVAGFAGILGGGIVLKKVAVIAVALSLLGWGGWAALRPPESPATVARGSKIGIADVATSAEAAVAAQDRTSRAALPAEPPEPPRASLRGVVKDEYGDPIPGAKVTFFDNVPEEEQKSLTAAGYRDVPSGVWKLEAVSNADGAFAFQGLLPGRAHVGAKVKGMDGGMPGFVLAAGKESVKDVKLEYLRRLKGQVRDKEGRAIAGAEVLVRRPEISGEALGMRDPESKFVVFPCDVEGRYDTGACLRVFPGSGQSLLAWADGFGADLQGTWKTGRTGLEATVDFELAPERPLVLRVKDSSQVPIADAEIGLGNARGVDGWMPYPLTHTGLDGAARVEHLWRKTHALRVAKSGYHAAGIVVSIDGPDEIDVTLQAVGFPIQVHAEYDMRFPSAARPVLRPTLEIRAPGGEFENVPTPQHHETPPCDCAAQFQPRERGFYRVVCELPGEVFRSEPFEYTGKEAVEVALPVVHPLPPFVGGTVINTRDGKPMAGVPVTVLFHRVGKPASRWANCRIFISVQFPGPLPDWICADTDAEGRFLALLPPKSDPMEIEVRAGSSKLGWSETLAREGDAATALLDLELTLRSGGILEGKVIDNSQSPVSGEVVVAYDLEGEAYRGETASDGTFRFENLRPGRYALESLGEPDNHGEGIGSGFSEDGLPGPELVFDRQVDVRAGETTFHTIDVSNDRLGSIEGSLGAELPREGMVTCSWMWQGRVAASSALSRTAAVRRGAFQFRNLFSGEHTLVFTSPTGSAEARASVQRGETTRVELSAPQASLLIPLPPLEPGDIEALKVANMERRGRFHAATHEDVERWDWDPWPTPPPSVSQSGILVSGLSRGVYRTRIFVPGRPEVWLDDLSLQENQRAVAAQLVFAEPRKLRVRLEARDGSTVPSDAKVSLASSRGDVSCSVEKVKDEPIWVLSPLPAGEYWLSAVGGRLASNALRLTIAADQDTERTIVLDGK